jgi:hypothetical protein
MTIKVYSPNNVAQGKINPEDNRVTMNYYSTTFKCTWKNYDETFLYEVQNESPSTSYPYGGQTPTHYSGDAFIGWSDCLDDNGNLVKIAMFDWTSTDDAGVSDRPSSPRSRASWGTCS